MLIGRRKERAALDGTLEGARGGRSGVMVITGEAGVGKSALLAYVIASAQDLRVIQATGVESEIELPFAAFHQLCAPLLDRLERLPGPQSDALAITFGLRDGPVPSRFLVGLAALSLLSEAAAQHPLVCVVDDAQWLDRESAQALAFVARRLLAESVVMLFAAREPAAELGGLPELVVEGLPPADARELLASVIRWHVDELAAERFVVETRGNPLALLELARELSPSQLPGGFGLQGRLSLPGRLEDSFVKRLRALPEDSQKFLLVAAADPTGDPALIWRAARRLGIAGRVLEPAESAGLVEVGTRLWFRHPLVRSALYRTASLEARREVHGALAEVTDASIDPDHRAWHRAEATAEPDEEVAAELERSADRARARGGFAASAVFLERSVALTLDPTPRTRRALMAAWAKFETGSLDDAAALLAIAERGPDDELQRARVERLRALIGFARAGSAGLSGLTVGPQAPTLLLDTAKRLASLDSGLARETYLDAVMTAMWMSGRGGSRIRAVAEAARHAPPAPQPPRRVDLILDALAIRFTQPYPAAVPALRQALSAIAQQVHAADGPRWLWFVCPVTPEPLASEVWDDETWHELAARAVTLARDAGALALLPNALTGRATVHVLAGELDAASGLIDEAYAIAEAIGSTPLRYPSLLLAAWRGQEPVAVTMLEAVISEAKARGLDRPIGFAHWMTAVMYNGLARYGDALAAAQRALTYEDLGFSGFALIELVEAATRIEDRDVASRALRQLAERTRATGTDWALGIEARSRALLCDGDDAEQLYREAIDRLERTRVRVEYARGHLVYGEWLRREGRRVDARKQLRIADDMFTAMGVQAFAARAERELQATGERVRKRTVQTRDELTAQEAQIARFACEGLSNPEIGMRLFISRRTVEYHMHKVFNKLGISSRFELARSLRELSIEAEPKFLSESRLEPLNRLRVP